MNRDRPYVLLLWPGGLFAPDASFGVPQLLCLAGALANDAIVDVVDLNMERARGAVDLRRIAERRRYTLVGIAAYSSFEYLKVRAIALHFRELIPEATIVVGGYHASARPLDFLDADSPIDHVVVGDGERPLQAIMQSVIRGVRYPGAVVGPLPTMQMSEQPPYDWSLLEQYRTLARTGRRQAEIYLSRGCP